MSRYGRRAAWWIGVTASVAVLAGGLTLAARMLWLPSPITRARVAYDRGDWQRAADAAREAMKDTAGKSTDFEAVRIYARTLVRLGREPAALGLYDGRLASAELGLEDRFLKGLATVRTGRPEAGLEIWQNALKDGAVHPEMLDHFSRLSLRLQRTDQALDAARKLARQPGWEARGLFLLAEISELIDDPPGVVAALESALRLEPGAKGALFDAAHYRKLLARNLLRLGRGADAEVQLAAVVPRSISPEASAPGDDREVQWLFSRAYLQQGRMDAAADALAQSGNFGAEHRLTPEPGPYVGSDACAPCHREESRAYEGTRHTRTFYHGSALLDLPRPDRPVPDPDDPRVLHTIERQGSQVIASTTTAGNVARMVVEYAFGTPGHYLTMIARDDARDYRALRVSYFHAADGTGWGPSAGDVGHSGSEEERLGQKVDVRDGVVRCLHCHVTRSRDFRDPPPEGGPSPAAADRGIGCERCHGPGRNHILAVEHDLADRQGYSDFAIINVAGTPATTANGQCVECHTVGPPPLIAEDPTSPGFVRSPGVTFTYSRCFTESNGTLSCITCHDPHREADHTAAFYEAKCLSCHSATKTTSDAAPRTHQKTTRGATCPVNPAKDCLRCHMPRIHVPTLHLELTDHFIRIRRSNASSDGPGTKSR